MRLGRSGAGCQLGYAMTVVGTDAPFWGGFTMALLAWEREQATGEQIRSLNRRMGYLTVSCILLGMGVLFLALRSLGGG